MNFITEASRKKGFANKISVFSSINRQNHIEYKNENVKLYRFKGITPNTNRWSKLVRYFIIYSRITLFLYKKKPEVVIYFETLSALPLALYIFFSRKSNRPAIYIHYHELVTIQELSHGRWLNKLINSLEKRLYLHAKWISQTNLARLQRFSEQYSLNSKSSVLRSLPNYPPSSWIKTSEHFIPNGQNRITKLLHIGALSKKGMFLETVLDHFGNNAQFVLDFYSHNLDPEIAELISKYNNCSFNGSIAYQDIPSLKGLYDIGLVLYKANSTNVIYCAPNKIFEYLALDLDVWCSDTLITARDYERLNCFPKTIMVNFSNLNDFDIDSAKDRNGLTYCQSPYFCEPVYDELLNVILENSHP